MFLNVPRLLYFIENHVTDSRKIYGNMADGNQPVRSEGDKFYVSLSEYKYEVYPKYILGAAYLMTIDIVYKVYKKSMETNFFKFEDVFINGLVASQQLNIEIVNVKDFFRDTYYDEEGTQYEMDKVMTFLIYDPAKMYFLWSKIMGNTTIDEKLKPLFEK